MARIGINHQIIPASDPGFYEKWWSAIAPWAKLVRVDPHMDAYAWHNDPFHVYSNGQKAMDPFIALGDRCAAAKIGIDFIRDGFPSATSHYWTDLGGDWSSFAPPNTWRQYQLPKEVWPDVNKWITQAAKALNRTTIKVRWQGPNEQFYRGHDQQAYQRMKSVYGAAAYGRPWTSPALWGPRPQLMRSLEEWETMRKYDSALSRPTILAANVYPDWTPGVTIDEATNIKRLVENLILVNDLADARGLTLVIPEFGFAKNQMPDVTRRINALAFVVGVMNQLPRIEAATLYWDAGDYYLSPEDLTAFGEAMKTVSVSQVSAYIADVRKAGIAL